MRIDSTRPVQRRAAWMVTLLALVLSLQAAGSAAQVAPPPAPLTERERAIHLLSRATYGVREQDVEEVLRMGRKAWLEKQLTPEYPPPRSGPSALNLRFSLGGSFGALRQTDPALFMTIPCKPRH
jgi:hypothetical protein